MTNFVIGLLVVQLLGGIYQLTFVLGAGQKLSNARATRLPDSAVIGHTMTSGAAAALWLGWVAFEEEAFIWATLATLVLTSVVGGFLFYRTEFRGPVIDRPAADLADVRVAEKQIPKLALHAHGAGALLLVVCVLLVGLGIVD